MPIDELIKTMMQEFRQMVKTETVVGEPVDVGGTVIVPVSKISFGFGAGGGKKAAKGDGGSGTAGGGSVEPVAFIVIRDGKAQLMALQEKEISFTSLLEFAPDVLKKIKEFKEKRDKKQGDGDKTNAEDED